MDVKKVAVAMVILCCAGRLNPAQTAASAQQLTVERIYSQPSLSGRMLSGVAWTPDGASRSYLETKGRGKDARKELWSVSAATRHSPALDWEIFRSAKQSPTMCRPIGSWSGRTIGSAITARSITLSTSSQTSISSRTAMAPSAFASGWPPR